MPLQARRAFGVGVTGIFLFPSHDVSDDQFIETFETTRIALINEVEDPFVGVMAGSNHTSESLFELVVGSLQSEDLSVPPSAAFVVDAQESRSVVTTTFRAQNATALHNMAYFGGFEHQKSVVGQSERSIASNAQLVAGLVDVVVSRVDSLNPFQAARKAEVVRQSVSQKPHAAYGRISARNIDQLAPYVDKLLLTHEVESFVGSGEVCVSSLRGLVLMAKTAS